MHPLLLYVVAAQPSEQEEQLKAVAEPSNPVKFKKPHTKRAAVFRPKAGCEWAEQNTANCLYFTGYIFHKSRENFDIVKIV